MYFVKITFLMSESDQFIYICFNLWGMSQFKKKICGGMSNRLRSPYKKRKERTYK